jgi:O-antigen/teichoic acid export membrane protein
VGSSTTTRPTAWRQMNALLRGERLVVHNLILGGGTVVAGLLGIAFQSVFSHRLQPADYGAVFGIVTLMSLIGLPTSALTLLMARETSRDRAPGGSALSNALLRDGNRALFSLGLAVALALAIGAQTLSNYLRIPQGLLLAAAAGVPFTLALSLPLGRLQGEQRFMALSVISVSQAGLKLIAALVLGLVLGSTGIVAGISLATAAVYVAALLMVRQRRVAGPQGLPWLRPAAAYLGVVFPSTLALAVLLSADVLLVKHFFPTRVAGEYAAVAALGRAIFWGASAVAAVLFPKVVFRGAQGQGGSHLVGASLGLVALGGLAGLGLLALTSHSLLIAFAGGSYADVAGYLPWYAVGMIMLGAAAVLIATHQSRGKASFLVLLVPLSLLEPILLVAFHQNLAQVVFVVDVSMAMVAGSLGILYVVQSRLLLRGQVATTTASSAVTSMWLESGDR